MTFTTTADKARSSAPTSSLMKTPAHLEAMVHMPIKRIDWRKTIKQMEHAKAIAEREEHYRAEQAKRRSARLAKIEAARLRATARFEITYLRHPSRPIRLCKLFAEIVKFSLDEIKSEGRRREPTYYRQILMWVLKKVCGLSSTKIALMMGGRDHTTSLHACNKINANPEMLEHANEILKALLWREQSVYGRVNVEGQS